MARFGRTWWGQRFLEALEQFTDPGRLGRGRSYAHNGRIVEHRLKGGEVQAKVRGSINPYYGVYEEPIYRTTIKITEISAANWTRIVERIAGRADLITRLLQQEMPDRIEEVFATEGLSLLPGSQSDFTTDCSCPDWDNPCKHIAGVYYLLAADLDHDPFLLFALRGLSRDALHAELVKTSLGQILASSLASEELTVEPSGSYFTRPTKIEANKGDRKATPRQQRSQGRLGTLREFWLGARRLPASVPTSQARVPALLVKKHGDYPPFWPRDASFIGVMEELYERVRTKSPQVK